MTIKKAWEKPEIFLISSGDVDAKNLPAAHEGSYIGDHPKPGNPALHTLTFVNHTLYTQPLTVTSQDFIS